ncbi:MAG: hep Hag family protein [Candidatus Kaiserbacteria bacterium]|nr:hep Hag family protein [Candidatus Kaiserbacteria bacterium]
MYRSGWFGCVSDRYHHSINNLTVGEGEISPHQLGHIPHACDNVLVNRSRSLILSILVVLALSSASASAWTGPTASPPSGNVAAPLNVSTADQLKHGWIGLDSMSILNHLIISGAANSPNTVRYLNFGATWDAAGYGIRDNAGTLEFKNSGGSWASIQSIVSTLTGGGSGSWASSGSNIYYTTGNVGIGTSAPSFPLDVTGSGSRAAVVRGTANQLYITDTNGTAGASTVKFNVDGDIFHLQIVSALPENDSIPASGTSPIAVPLSGANRGFVGIGTGNPTGQLEVDTGGAGVWAGMFNYSGGGSYGIWAHGTSYALYADGPIVSSGNVTAGGAILGTNGDLYMPWKAQWLSTVLTQSAPNVASIVTGSSGYIGNYKYCAWGGGGVLNGIYPASGQYGDGTYTWYVDISDGQVSRINCF